MELADLSAIGSILFGVLAILSAVGLTEFRGLFRFCKTYLRSDKSTVQLPKTSSRVSCIIQSET